MLDDILNRVPCGAPYVGASAFAHKAGLHASAILKDPATYEHIPPERSAMPGSSRCPIRPASRTCARGWPGGDRGRAQGPRLGRILDLIKEREDQGYAYDGAQASFELLARRELGLCPEFFEVKRYRVTVERRKNRTTG
jgi:2-isopropylmalate synthase